MNKKDIERTDRILELHKRRIKNQKSNFIDKLNELDKNIFDERRQESHEEILNKLEESIEDKDKLGVSKRLIRKVLSKIFSSKTINELQYYGSLVPICVNVTNNKELESKILKLIN